MQAILPRTLRETIAAFTLARHFVSRCFLFFAGARKPGQAQITQAAKAGCQLSIRCARAVSSCLRSSTTASPRSADDAQAGHCLSQLPMQLQSWQR